MSQRWSSGTGCLVAKVFSPKGDIGPRLVSAGWALAYRMYSTDYVDAENDARNAKRGIWRGTFVQLWEWRTSSPRRPRHQFQQQAGSESELVRAPQTGHRSRLGR